MQFFRSLSKVSINLSQPEMEALYTEFHVETKPGFMNYIQFSTEIDTGKIAAVVF